MVRPHRRNRALGKSTQSFPKPFNRLRASGASAIFYSETDSHYSRKFPPADEEGRKRAFLPGRPGAGIRTPSRDEMR
jgi:hypothetical protein